MKISKVEKQWVAWISISLWTWLLVETADEIIGSNFSLLLMILTTMFICAYYFPEEKE